MFVTVIMTIAIARVHPIHLMNANWAPGGHPAPTLKPNQPTRAVSLPINRYHPHPPSPFVITQPKTWQTFYPEDGGRLSRPRHCRKGAQHVPEAVHSSGCRDKHDCPWPHYAIRMLPLDSCDLQRQIGVNNLPKVVTQQHSGWASNSQPSSSESDALISNYWYTKLPFN